MLTDVDFCHQGGTQKLSKNKIIETYWHDHSLESSWGALSDGTIILFDSTILGGKMHFLNFSHKTLCLAHGCLQVKYNNNNIEIMFESEFLPLLNVAIPWRTDNWIYFQLINQTKLIPH
jgi:hypothetical protein